MELRDRDVAAVCVHGRGPFPPFVYLGGGVSLRLAPRQPVGSPWPWRMTHA